LSWKLGKKINDGLSVYTGEMIAILLALQWVEDTVTIKISYFFRFKFIICDSSEDYTVLS